MRNEKKILQQLAGLPIVVRCPAVSDHVRHHVLEYVPGESS